MDNLHWRIAAVGQSFALFPEVVELLWKELLCGKSGATNASTHCSSLAAKLSIIPPTILAAEVGNSDVTIGAVFVENACRL
ncbi:MAG: hypothetical protein JST85_02000 [Acidobacteria bacterium]|nr:hypothetical protein [Acidobacteriota bacterium]